MPQDLTQVSASELIAAHRSTALSPVEVATATLTRIAELQPHFNAYRAVDAEGTLAQAKASEARWAKGAPLGLLD